MDPYQKPLNALTVAELRAWAQQYRGMAATASPAEVVLALLKLAERYEALAADRDVKEDSQP